MRGFIVFIVLVVLLGSEQHSFAGQSCTSSISQAQTSTGSCPVNTCFLSPVTFGTGLLSLSALVNIPHLLVMIPNALFPQAHLVGKIFSVTGFLFNLGTLVASFFLYNAPCPCDAVLENVLASLLSVVSLGMMAFSTYLFFFKVDEPKEIVVPHKFSKTSLLKIAF